MEILQEKQNLLLKRKEVKVIVESDKNPNMQESAKMISEQFKTSEENIAVSHIKGKFGRNTFLINANVYESKEGKEKAEPKAKEKKGAVETPKENKEGDKK